MKLAKLLGFALVLSLAFPTFAAAQAQSDAQALEDHMRKVRSKVAQKRDSALKVLLEMTDEQAKAFWPLQKQYDKELKELWKVDRELTKDFNKVYKNMTTESAAEIGKRFFDLERDRLALQEKYLKLMSDQVSPVIATLFIQLERRFETELEMERMKYSPLAE